MKGFRAECEKQLWTFFLFLHLGEFSFIRRRDYYWLLLSYLINIYDNEFFQSSPRVHVAAPGLKLWEHVASIWTPSIDSQICAELMKVCFPQRPSGCFTGLQWVQGRVPSQDWRGNWETLGFKPPQQSPYVFFIKANRKRRFAKYFLWHRFLSLLLLSGKYQVFHEVQVRSQVGVEVESEVMIFVTGGQSQAALVINMC